MVGFGGGAKAPIEFFCMVTHRSGGVVLVDSRAIEKEITSCHRLLWAFAELIDDGRIFCSVYTTAAPCYLALPLSFRFLCFFGAMPNSGLDLPVTLAKVFCRPFSVRVILASGSGFQATRS